MSEDAKAVALTILIPVRNEGLNLRVMLKVLSAVIEIPHEVLDVHDEAADDSIPVVQSMGTGFPHVRTVHNTLGVEVINALRAGVQAGTGEIILVFAADEVDPVLAIDDMLRLMDRGCEFVSCTRYAHGGRRPAVRLSSAPCRVSPAACSAPSPVRRSPIRRPASRCSDAPASMTSGWRPGPSDGRWPSRWRSRRNSWASSWARSPSSPSTLFGGESTSTTVRGEGMPGRIGQLGLASPSFPSRSTTG